MKEKIRKLIERLVRYLISKYLPGYHLHRDPKRIEQAPPPMADILKSNDELITQNALRSIDVFVDSEELIK